MFSLIYLLFLSFRRRSDVNHGFSRSRIRTVLLVKQAVHKSISEAKNTIVTFDIFIYNVIPSELFN